ncbi:flavodoxin [Shewanella sp.]|uniref:flavodoxin n=1 Tax=Shewanella sp. TaxID=50422 RepID=UPI004054604E
MQKVNLVFGTVYGSAQHVAETLAPAIEKLDYEVAIKHPNELASFTPPEDELLIIICSTTGQGDLPDDIFPWFNLLKSTAPYLPKLNYSIIGLGDSCYETFCGAAKQFEALFEELGAKAVTPLLEIDASETMSPEDDALEWIDVWHNQVGH